MAARADGRRRSGDRLVAALLVVTLACLAVGALLHLLGAGHAGTVVWAVGGGVGAAFAFVTMADRLREHRLGVDVIALLAVVGALAVGEYLASAVIAVMLATGRALEGWAAGRADRNLRSLLQRAPRFANRYVGGGLERIEVGETRPGDRLRVASGDVVPTDGVLLTDAVLDESALTGEAVPKARASGEVVRSGAVNGGQGFDLRATASADESTYAGIVRLVAAARSDQAPFVRMSDRYSLWFLSVSLAAAALAWIAAGAPRAVAVLVVATPCPLILAAPAAFVGGLSLAARRGVIVKGGSVLERLARCTTVLLDKTGTLTSGRPTVTSVVSAGVVAPPDLLVLAASLDQVSPHVLARALVQSAGADGHELPLPQDVHEVAGRGIRGLVGGRRVALGKASWVGLLDSPSWAKSARRRARLDGSLTVFVGVDDQPAGVIVLDDPVRGDAARTLRSLREHGIRRIVMATGDRTEVAEGVGAAIGADAVFAERSPAEKLDLVRAEQRLAPTMMVGDGVNDAPALALADVGVAMGAQGASASSEAADVVLAVDRLDRLGEARSLAHRTRRIAAESVVAGMALSLGAMVPAALGFIPATWGALYQEAVDVLVILNALRALQFPRHELRLGSRDSALARRFEVEHRLIKADVESLRSLADRLGTLSPDEAMAQARRVHAVLLEDVEPHEEAEERELYPVLGRLLGGPDPTGPMSRAHAEIAHQIRRLGQLLDDIGAEGPDEDDLIDLRRLLYSLHAVLSLHTAQEEESYLSLGEEYGDNPAAAAASIGHHP